MPGVISVIAQTAKASICSALARRRAAFLIQGILVEFIFKTNACAKITNSIGVAFKTLARRRAYEWVHGIASVPLFAFAAGASIFVSFAG